MTGRLGDEDLNAEVRQTIRRTMIEVNPDTILLGESTNDAVERLPGRRLARRHDLRAVHPAALELAHAARTARQPAVIGFAARPSSRAHRRAVLRAHTRFAAGFPWRTRLAP